MSQGRALRIAAVLGVIVVLQGAAVLIYLRVERGQQPLARPFDGERLTTAQPAPDVELEHVDGRASTLSARRGKWVLVHFWATWCVPCRTELPGLLALGRRLEAQGRVELLAIVVDEEWEVVRGYFGGVVPPSVVRAKDAGVHRRFGASTFPDTYLVGTDGGLVERFAGSRDWTTPEAEQHLLEAIR